MISLAERHQYIIKKLQKEQYINVVDLCTELKVSSVTIRKDLKLLEDKNLLFKIHGGATLSNPYIIDRSVYEKEQLQSNETISIGQAAADLGLETDRSIIAPGTSVWPFART